MTDLIPRLRARLTPGACFECGDGGELTPLHEALLSAADTLERYTKEYAKHECACGNCWTCDLRKAIARLDALAKEGA